MNAQNNWEWLQANDSYLGQPPRRITWWKRPRIFYPTLCLIVSAMIALSVTAIVLGMDGMTGWRPNQSNAAGAPSDASAGDEDNVAGGLTTLEPSPSPTSAPTTAAPTSAPTSRPIREPRTIPLSFYVMGDGTSLFWVRIPAKIVFAPLSSNITLLPLALLVFLPLMPWYSSLYCSCVFLCVLHSIQ